MIIIKLSEALTCFAASTSHNWRIS